MFSENSASNIIAIQTVKFRLVFERLDILQCSLPFENWFKEMLSNSMCKNWP